MGAARQRKLDARARRQESLNNRNQMITVNETIVQEPKPNVIVPKIKNDSIVKVKNNKIPEVPVLIKRGPGRPRKIDTDNIKTDMNRKGKKLSGPKGKRK